MTEDARIPEDDWHTIVTNVPIVSVDLVVHYEDGIVLGKRTNEPLEGEWFVPGGRVQKNERLEDAVHRLAREELGIDVMIDRQMGVYEHLYGTAELDAVGDKHYVPIAYEVTAESETLRPDDQHATLSVFEPPFETLDPHPYLGAYLSDAGLFQETE
jgi:colanic acid biosynthesis protein WcaH